MAKPVNPPKVNYTYKGIKFATASKVVAKQASRGNLLGAFRTHFNNTIGRQMKARGLSPEVRENVFQQLVREGNADLREVQREVRKFKQGQNLIKRGIIEEAKHEGMSKAKLRELRRSLREDYLGNKDEAQNKVDIYAEERAEVLRGNIQGQYEGVLEKLRDSDDPYVRAIADKVYKLIEDYSYRYDTSQGNALGREISGLLNEGMLMEDIQISETGLKEIESAIESFDVLQTERATKEAYKHMMAELKKAESEGLRKTKG